MHLNDNIFANMGIKLFSLHVIGAHIFEDGQWRRRRKDVGGGHKQLIDLFTYRTANDLVQYIYYLLFLTPSA